MLMQLLFQERHSLLKDVNTSCDDNNYIALIFNEMTEKDALLILF